MAASSGNGTCAGSNCSVEAAAAEVVVMIVYSSQTERVVSVVVILAVLLAGLGGQLSVMATVWRTERLHTPHFVIIVCYCAFDILLLVCQAMMYVWCLIAGGIPLVVCRVLSFGGCIIFGMVAHIGYMAWERYVYFCRPLQYERLFATPALAAALMGMYSFASLYCIVTEVTPGRDYHSSVMACNVSDRLITWIQLVLFIIPTITITVVCCVKIWRLSRRLQTIVHPMVPSGHVTAQVSSQVTAQVMAQVSGQADGQADGHVTAPVDQAGAQAPGKVCSQANEPSNGESASPAVGGQQMVNLQVQARRAFRLIVLVAGLFWLTAFPVSIARSIIFSVVTWEDLDSRRDYARAIILRSIYFLYTLLSPLLNPLIYFSTRPDLWRAFLQLVGFKNNNAVHPMY